MSMVCVVEDVRWEDEVELELGFEVTLSAGLVVGLEVGPGKRDAKRLEEEEEVFGFVGDLGILRGSQ